MTLTQATGLSIIERLTAAHPSITGVVETRRARLLASLLLVSIVLGACLLVISMLYEETITDDPDILAVGVAVGITIGLYLLNRQGRFMAALLGFIGLTTVAFTVVPFLPDAASALVVFSALPVLLTAIFFPLKWVGRIAAALIVVVIALINFVEFSYSAMIAWYFLVFCSGLILVFMRHQQTLESLRRQELEEANHKLRQSEERLQTLNADLEHRVAERTRDLAAKNLELETAWAAAKEADFVKSQFLASMSHELRTPLNAILNFTEFVNIGMLGPVNERQQDALTKSIDSGRHLLSLINDVLDITKIEAGMISLFVEQDVDLNEIVTQGVTAAQALLKDKPVELVTEIDAALPLITADRRRARQILLNLLSNACKFTEEGKVTLRVKDEGDTVLLSVIDTGPGIAPADHAIIFEPFRQTAKGVQHAGGTGLGLPITLRLVEAHYGRLWLESDEGKGAAFHARLPVRAPQLQKLVTEVATA